LEDDLLRIFGSERMDGMLQKLGLEKGEAIVHRWINKALEKAQQKVEARNFEIRKNLLKFDDVMNEQRKVIYEQRRDVMNASDVSDTILDIRSNVITNIVSKCIPEKSYAEQWEVNSLHEEVLRIFGLDLPIQNWASEEGVAESEIYDRIATAVDNKMTTKSESWGVEIIKEVEKSLLLQVLDQVWKEHLLSLDHLRQGIGLRAYAQQDPLNEYKSEAFEMFNQMLNELDERITTILSNIELQVKDAETIEIYSKTDTKNLEYRQDSLPEDLDDLTYPSEDDAPTPYSTPLPLQSRKGADIIDPEDPTTWGKVGRNSPCPCGSGKKFKHCHGKY
tara:strand:- start:1438 stop:2439 length:1002 start_codon:yes stop_codon:yes gene_type:complete